MTVEREQKTAKAINLSLQQSAQKLQQLAESHEAVTPASARKVEQRLEALQADIEKISGSMLAYKLRRLADSKMLKQISEPSAVHTNTEKNHSTQKKPPPSAYQSSTFQCKSDLDLCLTNSKNALDKALCYALFIRCAIKG